MIRYQFKQFLGLETLTREYKEFTIPAGFFTPYGDLMLNLAQSSEWRFNHLVKRSIRTYMDSFVDKYRNAFLNPNSGTDYGELWIGVNDKGLVSGIPYQGEIDPSIVQTKHPDTIVEWIPVDIDSSQLIESTNPRVTHFVTEVTKSMNLLRTQKISYCSWRNEFNRYTLKLVELFNNPTTRQEFLTYVRTHSPETYNQVSASNFVMEQKKYKDIRHYIERKEGVYYWMCRWKDHRLREIRQTKPARVSMKQRHRASRFGPKRILSKVSDMIPYWMAHNDNMKLYLLRFVFRRNENTVIDEGALKRTLIVKHGKVTEEPCCVPNK